MKRKRQKLPEEVKFIQNYAKAGLTIGVGAMVSEKAGFDPRITAGFGTMSSMMPAVGAAGFGNILLKRIKKKKF